MPDDMPIQDELNAPVILPIVARLDGGPDAGGRAMLSIYGEPQAMQIVLENRSDRCFTLPPSRARIGLMLRADVLVQPEIASLDPETAAGWTLEAPSERIEGHVTLGFTPKETVTLAPNAELRLGLMGLIPDNMGGPRGTQVAIDYEGLIDEEGKSIADHLLLRLALADEEPGEDRADLLRTGSGASDGLLSLSFLADGGATILPNMVRSVIPLRLATVTLEALEINVAGPRTPALHIEPPSLDGGPEPIFHDSAIEGALVTNDGHRLEFEKAARITTAGTKIRLKTQTGTLPGLHPISIRYENLGPNCDMDGRLILLVLSHPIKYAENKAYAPMGLVVQKSFEYQGETAGETLSIGISDGEARIAGPAGGVRISNGPLSVDEFVGKNVDVTGALTAQKVILSSKRERTQSEYHLDVELGNTQLGKTDVRGDLMFTSTLYGPRAQFDQLNLSYYYHRSSELQHQWRSWVDSHGGLSFGMVRRDGEDLRAPDPDTRGAILLRHEEDGTGHLHCQKVFGDEVHGSLTVGSYLMKTPVLEFTGEVTKEKIKSNRIPERFSKTFPAAWLSSGIAVDSHGRHATNGEFVHKWEITVQSEDLVFLHNGIAVHRIQCTIESLQAGFVKS